MLTTIFTGHTLDLTHIRAVSGVMVETKTDQIFAYRKMYLEIFLKDVSTPIRVDQCRASQIGGESLSEQDQERWKKNFDDLTANRTALVEAWSAAVDGGAENMRTMAEIVPQAMEQLQKIALEQTQEGGSHA